MKEECRAWIDMQFLRLSMPFLLKSSSTIFAGLQMGFLSISRFTFILWQIKIWWKKKFNFYFSQSSFTSLTRIKLEIYYVLDFDKVLGYFGWEFWLQRQFLRNACSISIVFFLDEYKFTLLHCCHDWLICVWCIMIDIFIVNQSWR